MRTKIFELLFILMSSTALHCMEQEYEMDDHIKPTGTTKGYRAPDTNTRRLSATPPPKKKFTNVLKEGGRDVLAVLQLFNKPPFWLNPSIIIPSPCTHPKEDTADTSIISLVQNLWQYEGTSQFETQHKKIMKKIKRATQVELNTQNIDGWTALHFAVRAMDIQITGELLAQNANPNIQTKRSKCTPLHIVLGTAIQREVEICEELTDLLLEHGADTSLTNATKKTPFDYVKQPRKRRTKKRIQQFNGKEEKL